MNVFGERLKQAREARGIALEAIASTTHISRRYLDALERSDLDALPGGAFNKGYIRAYAQAVGIDPEPILDAYRLEERQRGEGTPEREQQMLQELSRLVSQRRARRNRLPFSWRGLRIALVGFFLALVATGTWMFLRNGAGPSEDRASRASVPAEPARREAGATSPTATKSPGSSERGAPEASDAPATGPRIDAHPSTAPQKLPTAPAAGPSVASTPAADSAAPRLAVSESGVGTAVVERRLMGRHDRFPEGTQVWFWTRVVRGEPGERLRHVWIHENRIVMRTQLTVGGPHWRTYTTQRLEPGSTGSWVVEARTLDGRVLAREEFVCHPAESEAPH